MIYIFYIIETTAFIAIYNHLHHLQPLRARHQGGLGDGNFSSSSRGGPKQPLCPAQQPQQHHSRAVFRQTQQPQQRAHLAHCTAGAERHRFCR